MNPNLERKLITVHGIDGTGKTTATDAICKALLAYGVSAVNYDEHEKSLKSPYRAIKKEILAGPVPQQVLFFLASAMFHSEEIERLLKAGHTVVKSRYILDVAADLTHKGAKKVEQHIALLSFLQPHVQVMLFVNETERMRRIAERANPDEKDLVPKVFGTRAYIFEQYLRRNARLIHPKTRTVELDSGSMDPTQIANYVTKTLRKM